MIDRRRDESAEEALYDAFGRVLGFAAAALLLLLGGGIAALLIAAAFFRFLYGG